MSASEASRAAAASVVDSNTNGDNAVDGANSPQRFLADDGAAEGNERPPSKKVRVDGTNGTGVPAVSALEDEEVGGVEDEDEGDGNEDEDEGEGEDGDEVEEESDAPLEGETMEEDPLEEVEKGDDDEDDVLDGDESD